MEIKKILVTIDGSEHSEKGVDIAISLVKESDRSILGLFVKPDSTNSLRYGDVSVSYTHLTLPTICSV